MRLETQHWDRTLDWDGPPASAASFLQEIVRFV